MAKGRNTFENYQRAKQERRELLITQYLEHLRSTRVKFPHVTALADMVASHVAYQEGHPCNKATLLRNKRYKSLLLTFMAAHLGSGTKSLTLKDVTDEKAKALVTTAQLEASNYKRECERLKAYVAHMEKNQGSLPVAPGTQQANLSQEAFHDLQLKYTRTCQALFVLLQHFGKSLSVDTEKELIVDLSRLRNNVVVEASIAAPFFEWLRLNSDVPGGTKS